MILPDCLVREEWKSDDFQEYIIDCANSAEDDELKMAAEYIANIKENLLKHPEKKLWPLEVRRYVTILLSNYFRVCHAKLSRKYINENNSIYNNIFVNQIVQDRLFKLIAEISFLHGESLEKIMNLDYRTNGYKSDYIHPRFLAKLIKIGDLLDTDNNRFNEILCSVYGELPHTSENHYKKHKAIEHLLVTPEEIEIRANCQDEEVFREIRKWFEWLKNEIEHFAIEWNNIVPVNFTYSAPKVKNLEILLKGKKVEKDDIDLKFKFEQKDAFEILEGSGIYENKLDFIRELIQNALDATKIQFWRDLSNGLFDSFIKNKDGCEEIEYNNLTPFDLDEKVYENYKISITVEESESEDVIITVKDKGIGIGKDDLNYMTKAGQSWEKRKSYKKDLKQMPLWLKPTGGFGVGLQSCFMMTDEITIYTKTSFGEGKKIILKSPKKTNGYFYAEKNSEKSRRGTKIVLKIHNDKSEVFTNKWYMGDYVDRKIRENDPFEEGKQIKKIDFIKNYLYNNLSQLTLFQIIVNKKIELSKCLTKAVTLDQEYKECYYEYDDNKKSIILWSNKNCILCKASLEDYDDALRHINRYKFKGVNVKLLKDRMYNYNTIGFSYEFDFNGFSTKNFLTLDRTKFIKSKEKEVVNIIYNEIIKTFLELFKQKIMSSKNHIKNIQNERKALGLYIDILNNQVFLTKSDKEEYLKNINWTRKDIFQKINITLDYGKVIYNYEFGTYKEFIKKYPNLNVINSDDLQYTPFGEFQKVNLLNGRLLEVIKSNKFFDTKNEIWILGENIFHSLSENYVVKKLNKIKKEEFLDKNQVKFLNGRYLDIYSFIDNKNKQEAIIEIDEFTKKIILKSLIKKDKPRNVIPGIKEYDNIAVKNLPLGLNYHELYYRYNRNYIISPFIDKDENIIKKCKTKDELIVKIQERKDFDNLLKYVQKNNIAKIKPTTRQIKEEYFKLIKDYFDIIKEGK